MKCKSCEGACIKFGMYRNGDQRFRCKSCHRCQKEVYVYLGCEQGIEKDIEKLTNESCSIRSISRILKVSTTKVIKTIRELWKSYKREKRVILFGREYELDEMRTFVGNKQKKYWIVYAIDRATKEVVDFKVGKRNNRTLKRVVDTLLLAKAKKIYTDGLKSYKTLIPESIHKVGKYKINKIERNNLSVRTHLKRLSRKTICFSKSVSMLEATLGLYFMKPGSAY
ncbi:MAG TPA: IS1 family transposase [Cytophagaceae bacterium]|jgi:IS1 family transposase/transposase-like protein|nr:IS1 family transposase [Cytophagaceae bacterium]